MIETVLKENALTDDVLLIPENGKIFSGNFIAIIEYFTYANEWGDRKHVKRFRKKESLLNFIDKNYKEFKGEICL